MEFRTRAVSAVFGYEFSFVSEIYKRVLADLGDKYDVSAASAVAAVGSALGDVFFTPERNGAVSAVAGFYIDLNVITEHIIHTSLKTVLRLLS